MKRAPQWANTTRLCAAAAEADEEDVHAEGHTVADAHGEIGGIDVRFQQPVRYVAEHKREHGEHEERTLLLTKRNIL
jgi:hypothetical protein